MIPKIQKSATADAIAASARPLMVDENMGTTVTSRRLAIMLRATLTKEGRAGRALVEWAEEHRSVFWPALKTRAKDGAKEKSEAKISWAKV